MFWLIYEVSWRCIGVGVRSEIALTLSVRERCRHLTLRCLSSHYLICDRSVNSSVSGPSGFLQSFFLFYFFMINQFIFSARSWSDESTNICTARDYRRRSIARVPLDFRTSSWSRWFPFHHFPSLLSFDAYLMQRLFWLRLLYLSISIINYLFITLSSLARTAPFYLAGVSK